jgi:predicted AAA+ superfamily ATPase
MYIQRKQANFLRSWLAAKDHKPLVLRGARQVGKSTLVELTALENGFDLCTVNFEQKPEYAEHFASNEPQKIIQLLQAQLQLKIIPGKTILFLDEIQQAPQVIISLRYFYEQMPTLHIIAAGSLLEFALSQIKYSIPVGRLEYIYLGPLSFSEFLLGLGEEMTNDFLQKYTFEQTIPIALHDKLLNLLRLYYLIGGMPKAVATYAQTGDLTAVDRVKYSIINTLQDDFSKYGDKKEVMLLRKTFNTIPTLIANKLIYAHIDDKLRSEYVSNAIDKLCLAKICEKVFHSSANGVPLGAEINERHFKILFLDIGLVNTILGVNLLNLKDNDSLILVNKGALAEQMIGQHLAYLRPEYEQPKLYYWNREKVGANSEVDYLITYNMDIIPVEVKAGKAGRLRSLHSFLREKERSLALRFNTNLPLISDEQINTADAKLLKYKLVSLPLYMVEQSYRLLEDLYINAGTFSD